MIPCKISGFRRDEDNDSALLGYYAECSGNSLPTFRDNVQVCSTRVKNLGFLTLEDWNYQYMLRNSPEKGNSQTMIPRWQKSKRKARQFTLEQAMKVQMGIRVMTLLFL